MVAHTGIVAAHTVRSLGCQPTDIAVHWRGHRLHEARAANGDWEALLHGKPVVFYVPDSAGLDAAVRVTVRWWC